MRNHFEKKKETYPYYGIIEELKKRGSKPGLEAIQNLLDVLGHPEDRLPVVHIAGTNGKGSVFAFLDSILQEAGYRVGRYISPTIHSYEERFQINGEEICPEKLEYYFACLKQALERKKQEAGSDEQTKRWEPTLFEVETALAFLYFAREKVDVALIETGMGGTYDATNVVSHPLLTVISSISYDHKAFLGETLSEIAAHKAGIIKEGVPVIVEENDLEICQVIKNRADAKQAASVFIKPTDYQILSESIRGSTFIWKKHRFSISLAGRHQAANAVTALEAAEKLKGILPPPGNGAVKEQTFGMEEMQRGLAKTRWPGRLELLCEEPAVFLDGAHNPDGARKLAQFLEKHFTNRRILYIMGVLKDKEYEKLLKELLPLASVVYTFSPRNERGLSGKELAICAEKFGVPAICCGDVNEAVGKAMHEAKKEDVLVICGSLSFMEEMKDRRMQRADRKL